MIYILKQSIPYNSLQRYLAAPALYLLYLAENNLRRYMASEDLQNLASWLQEILKEVQETRGATLEMRDKVNLLPEIREATARGSQDSGDAERKIDDTRNHLESKIGQLESTMNDMRSTLNDIRNKVDRLK